MLKQTVSDCLVKYSKQLIAKKNLLINDKLLEKKVKLLFLYNFLLEEHDCEDDVNKVAKHEILSLCPCTDCLDFSGDTVMVENWSVDTNNYFVKWERALSICLKQQTSWVNDLSSCVKLHIPVFVAGETICTKTTAWVTDIHKCTKTLTWISDVHQCTKNATWVIDTQCCEQLGMTNNCNTCN